MTLDIDYDVFSHQKSVAKSLYALNILESIMFKSSFLTTFAFNENGTMESSAKAVKKISIDEIFHYQMSNYLINRLRNDAAWAAAFNAVQDDVIAMYNRAIASDYEWADYVFPVDETINLLGINNEIVKRYRMVKTVQRADQGEVFSLLSLGLWSCATFHGCLIMLGGIVTARSGAFSGDTSFSVSLCKSVTSWGDV